MSEDPSNPSALPAAQDPGEQAPQAGPPQRVGPAAPTEPMRRTQPVEWLFLALGAVLVWRYRFFFDDGFVYFRYVDNLLFLKLGLVYNQGEYVEGYSSPLWTLILIALRATGLAWSLMIPLLGLLGFLLFWRMLVLLNRRLAPPGAITNLALAHLALAYGVLCYFTSGVETMAVQLCAVGYAMFVLRPTSLPLQVLLALSPLVRHELGAPFLLAAVWSAFTLRRVPWRMLGLCALFGAAWMSFRIVYYADLFPVTFYLKNQVDVRQGLRYLHDTLAVYHGYELFTGGLLLLLLLRLRGVGSTPSSPDAKQGGLGLALPQRAVMLALALSVTLYVVKIGGAPIHYRYLAFPYVLAFCALSGLPEHALEAWARPAARWLAPALGLALALTTAAAYPRQLSRHPLFADPGSKPGSDSGERLGIRYLDGINDAAYHRRRITTGGKWAAVTPDVLRDYRREHSEQIYQGVKADGWCERIYQRFDQQFVHSWGLTEGLLARVETPSDRPGHKRRLVLMAKRLVQIQRAARDAGQVGRGMYRRAVEAGAAPDWIVTNLETIEVLERKIYNRHRPLENLRLALSFPPKIVPAPLEIRVRRPTRETAGGKGD